jgi:hypothetical protein
MDPHQQTTPPASSPPTASLTGSQLEDQAAAANWEQSKKKMKLGIIIGGAVLLLGAAFIVFTLLTTKPNNEPLPAVDNSTPQPTQTASQVSKYKEVDYANGHGYTFKLKYFNDARTIAHCEVQIFKTNCLSPVSTRYLQGSKQGRPKLLFSIQPSDGRGDNCKITAFAFKINDIETPMCQEDLGGRTISYAFTLTISGEKLMGVFMMDNPPTAQFIDASQYKDDLKEISSSIQLYL